MANTFNGSSISDLRLSNVNLIDNNAFTGASLSGTLDLRGVKNIAGAKIVNGSADQTTCPFYNSMSDSASITSITFENLVTLGSYAFYGLNVESVDFSHCTKLRSIGEYAFDGCENLASMTLPGVAHKATAIFSIGDYAFRGTAITTALDLSCVTTIGEEAFYGVPTAGITLGTGVIAIGDNAFTLCTEVASITVDPANEYFMSENDTLYSKDQSVLYLYSGRSLATNFAIPDEVSVIKPYAFYNLSSLTFDGATPLSHVTEIGEYAFCGCSFTQLVLGPSLTVLGEHAFEKNDSLMSLVLPGRLTSVSSYAFAGCPLTEIHVSSSVTSIKAHAFDYGNDMPYEVSFWFNGVLRSDTFETDGLRYTGSDNPHVTFHVYEGSYSSVSGFVNNGIFAPGISKTVVGETRANVTFRGEEPMGYPTVSAIYGGKIVLPLLNTSAGAKTYYFALQIEKESAPTTYLAAFASEADYSAHNVARSGMAVPIYPAASDTLGGNSTDIITFYGTVAPSATYEYTVTTQVLGENPRPLREPSITVHYGGNVTAVAPYYLDFHIDQLIMVYTNTGAEAEKNLINLNGSNFRYGFAITSIKVHMVGLPVDLTFSVPGHAPVVIHANIGDSIVLSEDVLLLQQVERKGYTFSTWISNGIKIENIREVDSAMDFEADYAAYEYILELSSADNKFSTTVSVFGPSELYVDAGILRYTGAEGSGILFSDLDTPGYQIDSFYFSGKKIESEHQEVEDGKKLRIVTSPKIHTLSLTFEDQHGTVLDAAGDEFMFEGWNGTYTSGSVIEGIDFTVDNLRYTLPYIQSHKYIFSKIVVDGKTLSYIGNSLIINYSDFHGKTDVDATVTVISGKYNMFIHLDEGGERINNGTVSLSESILFDISSPYPKAGYHLSYITLALKSDAGDYTQQFDETNPFTVTQEMIDMCAEYCALTFTVHWESDEFTVRIDPGAGSPVDPIGSVLIGDSVLCPAVTGYIGHIVTGWTFSDSTAVPVDENGEFVLTQAIVIAHAAGHDVTISPVWGYQTYRLFLDSSNAVYPVLNVVYGSSIEFWTVNELAPQYKKFDGWDLGSTHFANVPVTLGDSIAAVADSADTDELHFAISWTLISYHVEYDLNGGDGAPPEFQYFTLGKTGFAVAPAGSISRLGFTFGGWSVTEEPVPYTHDGDVFDEDIASKAVGEIVLFRAIWAPQSYFLSYDFAEGMPGLNTPQTVMYGSRFTIDVPIRAGYTFAGWYASGLSGNPQFYIGNDAQVWGSESMLVNATEFRNLTVTEKGTVALTASWVKADFSLKFNLNGGNGIFHDSAPLMKVGDTFAIPELFDAVRVGYEFGGWTVDGMTVLTSSTVFLSSMVQDNSVNQLLLTAVWNPVSYELQYRYNDSTDYISGEAKFEDILAYPEISRTGYTFLGWTANAVSETAQYSFDGKTWYAWKDCSVPAKAVYFRQLSTGGDAVKLDARWESENFYFKYSLNGGSGVSSEALTLIHMDEAFPELGTPVRAGYTFGGWSIDGLSTVREGDRFVASMLREDSGSLLILTARWEPVTYSLQYRYDEASEYTSESLLYEEIVRLSEKEMVGYTFVGWKADALAGNAQYSFDGNTWYAWKDASDTVKAGYFRQVRDSAGAVHLDAVWTKINYQLVYNIAGGNGSVPSATIHIGDAFPSVADPVRPGYGFLGWTLDGNTLIADGAKFTADDISALGGTRATVTAEWEPLAYAVSYRYDSESDPTDDSLFFEDVLPLPEREWIGHTFVGWKSAAVGANAQYSFDGTVWYAWKDCTVPVKATYFRQLSSDGTAVSLTAEWRVIDYIIRYDVNGGSATGSSSVTINLGEKLIQVTDPVRSGYEFLAWSLDGYTELPADAELELQMLAGSSTQIVLTALWNSKTYRAVYSYSSEQSGTEGLYQYEEIITVPARDKAGYEFIGWSSEAIGSSAQYSFDGKIWYGWTDGTAAVKATYFRQLSSDGSDVELEAVYEAIRYTVVYNARGGSGISSDAVAYVSLADAKFPQLAQPAMPGYDFGGWTLDGRSVIKAGSRFDASMVSSDTTVITLNALWEPISYSISYRIDPVSGTLTGTYSYGETIVLSQGVRTGYTFLGWEADSLGEDAQYSTDGELWHSFKAGTRVKATYFRQLSEDGNSISIEAKWRAIDYTIRYDSNGGTGALSDNGKVYNLGDSITLADYRQLNGTNGTKSCLGWSLERNGYVMTLTEFSELCVNSSDSYNTLTLYAVWKEALAPVTIDLKGCTPDKVPAGWNETAPGVYEKMFENGTSMETVMAEWSKVTLSKDGYQFSSWDFSSSNVEGEVQVEPSFEKVDMNIMYVVGGVIAAIVVIAVVARFRAV